MIRPGQLPAFFVDSFMSSGHKAIQTKFEEQEKGASSPFKLLDFSVLYQDNVKAASAYLIQLVVVNPLLIREKAYKEKLFPQSLASNCLIPF